MIIDND